LVGSSLKHGRMDDWSLSLRAAHAKLIDERGLGPRPRGCGHRLEYVKILVHHLNMLNFVQDLSVARL
jgi:hypothetical protein